MAIKMSGRTTADEALRGMSLVGKTAIVTGANSGIGQETARVLAVAGAAVTLAVRSVDAARQTAETLRAAMPNGAGTLTVAALDLANLESVRAFAHAYLASGAPLDLLINNAGIMAPPLQLTAQGLESQMGTNHLGHFLLTALLRPRLEQSPAGRVVTVSSALHTRGRPSDVLATLDGDPTFAKRRYTGFGAYGDSKLANVLFTRVLAKRLPANVEAFSLHPGVILTNLTRSMGWQGAVFRTVSRPFVKSTAQGAATSIFAATAPELVGKSGSYLADCRVCPPAAAALDDTLADAVWDLSERRTAEA